MRKGIYYQVQANKERMSEVLQAIANRSSTRAYTSEKLTQEEIKLFVTAGLQAPTARNQQEIHISVVDGAHPILKKIDADKNISYL